MGKVWKAIAENPGLRILKSGDWKAENLNETENQPHRFSDGTEVQQPREKLK